MPAPFTRFLFRVLLLAGLWPAAAVAQAPNTPAPKRQLQAVRLTMPIKLDARLDEAAWQQAPVATDFIERRPTPGRRETHPTEVRVLYDDAALYVGAVLHDVAADSILREFSPRDGAGNTDWFGVYVDTYHDQLNAYGFFVLPNGVQLDSRISPLSPDDDLSWNAVWDSRTAVRGTDWVVELRIPFSALRFSNAAEQVWGINFSRRRQRDQQLFSWNEIRPAVNGFVNQFGELRGLRNLHPPLRLALIPYVSAATTHAASHEPGQTGTTSTLNGGADVKWGINEGFTLDATLAPDFGQVQSDNQALNLSPYEVAFQENRPFFTEGTELFTKGGLFYSRRVGGQPVGFDAVGRQLARGEFVARNPAAPRLLNATKVSGRTRRGLGLGVFNAVSAASYATVQDSATGRQRAVLTQPLTNYSIAVLDQSLPHNSYVSLINTNVARAGQTYNANATAGLFRVADLTNTYALSGRAVYTRRQGAEFGATPNAPQSVRDPQGYAYRFEAAKVSGNWQAALSHAVDSDTYNPNDLGLLPSNNRRATSLTVGYSVYRPFWKLNGLSAQAGLSYEQLFRPSRFASLGFTGVAKTTFAKSFLTLGLDGYYYPVTSRDYFEPRAAAIGRYYLTMVPGAGLTATVATDSRRPLALEASAFYGGFGAAEPGRHSYELSLSPRFRASDKLTFRYEVLWTERLNQPGYAGALDATNPLDQPYLDRIIMGRRRVRTVAHTLSGSYIFTNRMSLTMRGRHYFSGASYRDYFQLGDDGARLPTDYARDRSLNVGTFNLDLAYAWWFAPGSQISIVWKDAILTTQRADQATSLYFENVGRTFNGPQVNAFSIKLLYYLDYLALRPTGGQ